MMWILLTALAVLVASFFFLLLCLTWTHRPISLLEIIKELLFGSGKEK